MKIKARHIELDPSTLQDDNGALQQVPGTDGSGGGGLVWSTITVNTALAVNSGYVSNSGTLRVHTLPATAAVGDVIEVVDFSGNNFIIKVNTVAQNIFKEANTTVGGIKFVTVKGKVRLTCVVANTSWFAEIDPVTYIHPPTITNFTPVTGVINTNVPITITGTNFDTTLSNNSIVFDSVPYTPSSGSATQLLFTLNIPNIVTDNFTVNTLVGTAVSGLTYSSINTPATTRGYFGGGVDGANTTAIRGMLFNTPTAETSFTVGMSLAANTTNGMAGLSSSAAGYFLGGGVGTAVQGMLFNTQGGETSYNPSISIVTPIYYSSSGQSVVAGYVAGGSSGPAHIDRVIFNTPGAETYTAMGIMLNTGRYGSAGVSGPLAMYCAGGGDPIISDIDAIIHSGITGTETIANVAFSLVAPRVYSAGVQSGVAGYWGTGAQNTSAIAPFVQEVDGVNFNTPGTETLLNPAMVLAGTPRAAMAGSSGANAGYFAGGCNPNTSSIAGLQHNGTTGTEYAFTSAVSLHSANHGMAGLQK